MKRWGTVLLFLMLSGCSGPDQHILTRCENTTFILKRNTTEGCTCFRDNIKKALDHKTYIGVADSALGHDEEWAAYVRSLKPAKQEEVFTKITIAALTCDAGPWDELYEPAPGVTPAT